MQLIKMLLQTLLVKFRIISHCCFTIFKGTVLGALPRLMIHFVVRVLPEIFIRHLVLGTEREHAVLLISFESRCPFH